MRHLSLASVIAILWALAWLVQTPVGAECIRTDIGYAKRTADVIVEGTVTNHVFVTSGRITLSVDVHNIWKGAANSETTFAYVRTAEGPSLSLGDRRVLFGRRHTIDQRRALRIPDSAPPSVELLACISAMEPDRSVLSALGRPRRRQ